jgi:hypothetical protein
MGAPEESMKDRDWVAFVISIVSFVIAVLSFFFSTLLVWDDLRLVISEVPTITVDGENQLWFKGSIKFAVINSGNRPVSILSLDATARRAKKDDCVEAECVVKDETLPFHLTFGFGVQPFVLRPDTIKIWQ